MPDDPIGQRALEADVAAGFFGLDPFMFQNLLALGHELTVERRILQQIAVGKLFGLVGHTRNSQS